jgi:outer membrane protein assembly factor BamE (lipoprotein component of BamABCDE complex)
MNKALVLVACFLAILCIPGCYPSMDNLMMDWYAQAGPILTNQLNACQSAKMTQSELVMRVGAPTAKEALADAEIWIYQINQQGTTVSQTEYTPGDLFSNPTSTTTTDTPMYRASITIKFSKNGEMNGWAMQGDKGALYHKNNRFWGLTAPQR